MAYHAEPSFILSANHRGLCWTSYSLLFLWPALGPERVQSSGIGMSVKPLLISLSFASLFLYSILFLYSSRNFVPNFVSVLQYERCCVHVCSALVSKPPKPCALLSLAPSCLEKQNRIIHQANRSARCGWHIAWHCGTLSSYLGNVLSCSTPILQFPSGIVTSRKYREKLWRNLERSELNETFLWESLH